VTLRGVNSPKPGSYGLNTQDDILTDEAQRWATLATNAVIDSSGKLTSRADFVLQTSGFSGTVQSIYCHKQNSGTNVILSAAAGKIYSGTTTLTQRHDYSATSTGLNSWQFASLTSKIYGFQGGVAPFVLNEDTYAAEAFTGAPWTQSPNVCLSASGRLWVADDVVGSNSYTLWWSNLLDGKVWNSGDAGSLDVRKAWHGGQDSITAVTIFQDRVIIFGRNNILLYTLPADRDPADMSLTDSISNLGCIARDSVILAGGDLYFLAADGYYRIQRLAQITSLMNAQKVSHLVSDDFKTSFASQARSRIRAGYNPSEKHIALSFPTDNTTWCFHTDRLVPAGENFNIPAVTRWTNVSVPFNGFCFEMDANGVAQWYCAMENGIGKYTGYTPDGAGNAYDFEFYGQWTSLQDETRSKDLKSWTMTLETDSGQTGTFRWQLDHVGGTTRTQSFTCSATEFAEAPGIGVVKGQLGGSCNLARFGFTTSITGDKVALHSHRIYAKPGTTRIR
jgi:hypothetical protein